MNMKSPIYIDFSLLAILFALQVTNNPKTQNFKLAIVFLLFTHVITTSGTRGPRKNEQTLGSAEKIQTVDQTEQEVNEYDEVPAETENVIAPEEVKIVRKNVSDGEFDRNFSVPPGSKLLSGPTHFFMTRIKGFLLQQQIFGLIY